MKCSDCGREVCYTATGRCPQCTPRQAPSWGIFQADHLTINWLQWNWAIQIMETTTEKRHAAQWDSRENAEHAAAYYGIMFGELKVTRIDQ